MATVIKLPDLPQNWREQPQLFERYWSDVMRQIGDQFAAIIATQEQLEQAVLAIAQAQATADTAQNTATGAQTTADNAQADADTANMAAAIAQATANAAVPQSRLINTAGGLTGGGDLTADRTLSIANVMTAGTYTFTVGAQSIAITVNTKGQVTNIVIV